MRPTSVEPVNDSLRTVALPTENDRLAMSQDGQQLYRETLGDLPNAHRLPKVLRTWRWDDLDQSNLL